MSRDIETILDHCIEEMQAGRSMDALLEEHPDMADKLRPLLEVVDGLQTLPDPPLVIGDLMSALTRTVNAQDPPQRERPRSKVAWFSHPILMRVAAGFALVFALGLGSTVASANTVPGDFLYPVKRLVEKVRLVFSVNNNEAELRITFSEERFAEGLKKYYQDGVVDDALFKQMLEEAKLALDEALELPPEEQTTLISRVGYLAAHQKNVIETMSQSASPATKKALEPFAEMCGRRMRWMEGMMRDAQMASPTCPNCSQSGLERAGSTDNARDSNTDSPRRSMGEWMQMCPNWN
ncbi:MAG: hypothetical protein CML13_06210 [Puniceicoccaceae bacterium]|nr:hypothetical protein [Puniceicoccaceae bacterium]|tara:strand:+ start:1931 stop:2812 length:882 start_codon:yes stop_codon:yes gene_type:complete